MGIRKEQAPRRAGAVMSWAASRRLLALSRRRALRAFVDSSELFTVIIRSFLLADVSADLLQFEPDHGHRARPEVLAGEVPLLAGHTRDCNRALPVQESDRRSACQIPLKPGLPSAVRRTDCAGAVIGAGRTSKRKLLSSE